MTFDAQTPIVVSDLSNTAGESRPPETLSFSELSRRMCELHSGSTQSKVARLVDASDADPGQSRPPEMSWSEISDRLEKMEAGRLRSSALAHAGVSAGGDSSELDSSGPRQQEPNRTRRSRTVNIASHSVTPAGDFRQESRGIANIVVAAFMEYVGGVVRREVEEALKSAPLGTSAAPSGKWMTPPKASKETGVPEKTIRKMIADGVLTPRLRNASPNPRQRKFLVNVDAVAAEAERFTRVTLLSERATLAERAARIRTNGQGK